MAGCSLDDAFPDNTEKVGKIARKEERKKAALCKGPALSFLKGGSDMKDPDRQAEPLPPPPEKMESGPMKSTPDQKDSYGNTISNYFGKSETDESFADFAPSIEDNPGYKLQPDFSASFKAAGFGKASGVPLQNEWKPMSDVAFFNTSPKSISEHDTQITPSSHMSQDDKALLQKKIDTLFARLESMECQSSEYVHTEIALFILSGLFLLFGLETIRKFR